MPRFSEVFSTTLKVVGALTLIAIIAGVGYLLLNVVTSSTSNKGTATGSPVIAEYERNKKEDARKAMEVRTSMPLSRWNRLVAAGIKQHCAFVGMNSEEAEKALGKPSAISKYSPGDGESWTYETEDRQKCHKYQGDICTEFEKHEEIVFISADGYVVLSDTGEGCFKEPFLSMHIRSQQ